jgi:Flp pilus assembly protein TadG
MKTIRPTVLSRHRGSVAVELAGVFMVLAALLWPIFLISRVYYQYNVVLNAAALAAHYAAAGTTAELQSGARETTARTIVTQLLADSAISAVPTVRIACQPSLSCNASVTGVQSMVEVQVPPDIFFFPDGLYVTGSVTVRYP